MRDEAAEAEVGRRFAAALGELGEVTDLPLPAYVAGTENRDAGYLFYRVEDGRHLLLARERGRETLRRETLDADTLVRWLVESVTREMATTYEVHHRRRREDSRRQWFALWVELMTRLDPAWGRATQA